LPIKKKTKNDGNPSLSGYYTDSLHALFIYGVKHLYVRRRSRKRTCCWEKEWHIICEGSGQWTLRN